MIALDRSMRGSIVIDIAARAIALTVCGGFWWTWLTIGLGIVVSLARTTKVDVAPSVILATAAVAVTLLTVVGGVVTHVVFGAARANARAALLAIAKRR